MKHTIHRNRCPPLGTLGTHDIQAMRPSPTTTQAIATGKSTTSATRLIRSEMVSGCQTLPKMSSAHLTMAFKNEVVTDEDIDRYNLPFSKGGGRWWTRDAERDYYLWGGLVGNPAYDDVQEGWFCLHAEGITYSITLMPGEWSQSLKELPFVITWEKILQMSPEIDSKRQRQIVVEILKMALTEYGYDGENNMWPKAVNVVFKFG
jgi:hypothetical protein